MTKKLRPVNKSGFVERGVKGEPGKAGSWKLSAAPQGTCFVSLGILTRGKALWFAPEKQVMLHCVVPATAGKLCK